jgi:thioester reductase-like protein
MPTLFFTGYPGFLGSELLPRLLRRDSEARAVCIVQPKFAALATERMLASPFASRIRLVEGDITQPRLGLREPVRDVAEVYHLAAVYDLMVPRALGLRVNVEGTRNVLDFAAASPALRRVHYISTCYVSGSYPGLFREDDLEKGQTFNNFYEETKYLAEVEVRRRMRGGLPATIYRPAVVVGDSTTGATQKFDGPYFVIQWLLRQPRIAILPVAGRPSRYRFNVVPRNFIVDAIEALSARADSLGRTYHLADPEPLTVDETINAVASATGRKVVRVPLPKSVAKFSLDHVPGMYRLMRIPSGAVDYFVHPTLYDTSNARRDLTIPVPHLRDYLPRLIDFVRAHPEIGSEAMA